MICPNCKSEITSNSVICGFCGAVLADFNNRINLDGSIGDNLDTVLTGTQSSLAQPDFGSMGINPYAPIDPGASDPFAFKESSMPMIDPFAPQENASTSTTSTPVINPFAPQESASTNTSTTSTPVINPFAPQESTSTNASTSTTGAPVINPFAPQGSASTNTSTTSTPVINPFAPHGNTSTNTSTASTPVINPFAPQESASTSTSTASTPVINPFAPQESASTSTSATSTPVINPFVPQGSASTNTSTTSTPVINPFAPQGSASTNTSTTSTPVINPFAPQESASTNTSTTSAPVINPFAPQESASTNTSTSTSGAPVINPFAPQESASSNTSTSTTGAPEINPFAPQESASSNASTSTTGAPVINPFAPQESASTNTSTSTTSAPVINPFAPQESASANTSMNSNTANTPVINPFAPQESTSANTSTNSNTATTPVINPFAPQESTSANTSTNSSTATTPVINPFAPQESANKNIGNFVSDGNQFASNTFTKEQIVATATTTPTLEVPLVNPFATDADEQPLGIIGLEPVKPEKNKKMDQMSTKGKIKIENPFGGLGILVDEDTNNIENESFDMNKLWDESSNNSTINTNPYRNFGNKGTNRNSGVSGGGLYNSGSSGNYSGSSFNSDSYDTASTRSNGSSSTNSNYGSSIYGSSTSKGTTGVYGSNATNTGGMTSHNSLYDDDEDDSRDNRQSSWGSYSDRSERERRQEENIARVKRELEATRPRRHFELPIKQIVMGIVLVAIVIVLVFAVIFFLPWIKNATHSKAEAKDYLTYVVEKDTVDKSGSLGNIYENYNKTISNAFSNRTKGKVEIAFEPAGKNLLGLAGLAGIDLSWLNKIAIDTDINIRESKYDANLGLMLNDVDLYTVRLAKDDVLGNIYFQIPELTNKCLRANLKGNNIYGIDAESATDYKDDIRYLISVLPKTEDLQDIYCKYSKFFLTYVDQVQKSKGELTAEQVSQKCTVLSYDISGEKLEQMRTDIMEALKNEPKINDIFEKYQSFKEEGDYKEEFLEAMDKKLKESGMQSGSKASVKQYVNAKGEIAGVEIAIGTENPKIYRMFFPQKGMKIGLEISSECNGEIEKFSGTGKIFGGKVSGEYALTSGGKTLLKVTTKGFDIAAFAKSGVVNGKFHVEMEEGANLGLQNSTVSSTFRNLAFDLNGKMSPDNGQVEVTVWNNDNKLWIANYNWNVGTSNAISFPKDADCYNISDMREVMQYVDSISDSKAKEFTSKWEKIGIPKSLLESLTKYAK